MTRATLRVLTFTAWAVMLSANAHAAAIVIDFESFSDFDSVTTQIPGVTFANTTVLTAGISLNELDFPPASGTDVAFDDGGPVRIDFLNPLAAFAAKFTYAAPLTLRAFDAGNNELAAVSSAFSSNLVSSADPGSSPNELLEVLFSGITYVTITGSPLGASFVFDDVVLTPAATAPEPGMLSLLALGAGAMRACARRRRRRIDSR
jgi:hypothetical protein